MLGGLNHENPKALARLMSLSQVGMEMAAPILVGLFFDRYFATSPWCVIGGAVLGFVGGFAHIIALTKPDPTDRAGGSSKTATASPPDTPAENTEAKL
jgi:F0F1-type ATP synthase assembly protein I